MTSPCFVSSPVACSRQLFLKEMAIIVRPQRINFSTLTRHKNLLPEVSEGSSGIQRLFNLRRLLARVLASVTHRCVQRANSQRHKHVHAHVPILAWQIACPATWITAAGAWSSLLRPSGVTISPCCERGLQCQPGHCKKWPADLFSTFYKRAGAIKTTGLRAVRQWTDQATFVV